MFHKIPDLVIFRIPTEDKRARFRQVEYNHQISSNGLITLHLSHDEPKEFYVSEEDSYNSMSLNHFVLAEALTGGSRDIERYICAESEIHKIHIYELTHMIDLIVNQEYRPAHLN